MKSITMVRFNLFDAAHPMGWTWGLRDRVENAVNGPSAYTRLIFAGSEVVKMMKIMAHAEEVG